MNRKNLISLLACLLLMAGVAHAEYSLEMEIEYPNATNIIYTNLEGTGDQFTVKARVLDNGVPVNYPDMLELRWEFINNYFLACDAVPSTLQPSSGPDAEGWYSWDDIRLLAGSVEVQWENPGVFNTFKVHASKSYWFGSIGDWEVGGIRISSPDLTGHNGVVNLSDIQVFTGALNGTYRASCDFNGDGVINLSDIASFTPAIGTTCAGPKLNLGEEDLVKALGEKGAVDETTFSGLKSMYR